MNNKQDNSQLKFSLKKWRTKKLILKYNLNNKDGILFFTDSDNLKYILKNGLFTVDELIVKKGEHYIVWAYSQKKNELVFELFNEPHNDFWLWFNEEKINISKLVTICFDVNLLFKNTKKNWKYDLNKKQISIFEHININSIKWIAFKNLQAKNEIDKYIINKGLNIKTFHADKGKVNS